MAHGFRSLLPHCRDSRRFGQYPERVLGNAQAGSDAGGSASDSSRVRRPSTYSPNRTPKMMLFAEYDPAASIALLYTLFAVPK